MPELERKDECGIIIDEDKAVLLSSHNHYRKVHNVSFVQWDEKLAESALEWAYNLSKYGHMKFSPQTLDYSENIFKTATYDQFTLLNVVNHWYNTGENYIYRTKADVKADAFAQIVWDDVKFLGCGTCRNTAKQLIIVVCRYRPRANIGDYSQHVRPPFENETNQPKSYVFVKSECKNLIEKAESAILDAHNAYRKKHNVTLLKWDKELAASAVEWAYSIANQNQMEFSPQTMSFSENIYKYSPTDDLFEQIKAVDYWYNTGRSYRYTSTVDRQAGAFTQVVWDDVRFLGCGSCLNKFTQLTYVVCRYKPRANIGDYSLHVRPIPSDSSLTGLLDQNDLFDGVELADEIDVMGATQFAHNVLRIKYHGLNGLKWSEDLAKGAQYWSKKLSYNNEMKPSPITKEYGENVYKCTDCTFAAAANEAIRYWYSTIKDYSFDDHTIHQLNYHAYAFTQIVWNETQYLGCGISLNKKLEISVVVCRYKPRGNIGSIENFKKNVKPPKSLLEEMTLINSLVFGKGRDKDIPSLKELDEKQKFPPTKTNQPP